MSLIVQKYGGTSVGSVERIEAVADKIATFFEKGHEVVVAVSAMSGETNRLINLAQEVNDNPNRRELDVLLSTGEQVSISLLCMALNKRDIQAKSYTGHQVRILTDNAFGKARIKDIDSKKIFADLKAGFVTVIAGFQGIDEEGNILSLIHI